MADRRASASSFIDRHQPSLDQATDDIFNDDYAESYADSTLGRSPGLEDDAQNPFDDANLSSYELGMPSVPLSQRRIVPAAALQPRHSIRKPTAGAYSPTPYHETVLASTRRPSTASIASTAQSRSQTHENNGPSHPYTMYPQGLGLSRSASAATSSAQRGTASTRNAHQGPSHQYHVYRQDMFADPTESAGGHMIPVGFPGLSHGYERRLGPEGEEQDIIGPDGHTEQLPPYTRFAGADNPKIEPRGMLSLEERSESLGRFGAFSPLHRNITPPSPAVEEIIIQTPVSTSTDAAAPSEEDFDEKRWRNRTWKERRKYKLWGVLPLWLVVLGVLAIVVVAIICASVVGNYVEHHFRHPQQEQTPPPPPAAVTVTQTLLIDATAVTSPIATPSARFGTFSLPLRMNNSQTSASCLISSNQSEAWSCHLPSVQAINITITPQHQISIFPGSGSWPSIQYQYGSQVPNIPLQQMQLVVDLSAPGNGMAYHIQTVYDKLVVLPGPVLNLARRDVASDTVLMYASQVQHDAVQPGQQPWFCHFNKTMIEGFVYVQAPPPPPSLSVSCTSCATQAIPASITSSQPEDGAGSGSYSPAASYTIVNPSTTTTPQSSATTAASLPATISSSLSVVQAQYNQHSSSSWGSPSWVTDWSGPPRDKSAAASSYWQSVASQSGYPVKRSPGQPWSYGQAPYMVKLQERRVPNGHVQPYCQQMQLLDNGLYNPVSDADGRPLIRILDEVDPTPNYEEKRDVIVERDSADTCFCAWSNFGT